MLQGFKLHDRETIVKRQVPPNSAIVSPEMRPILLLLRYRVSH